MTDEFIKQWEKDINSPLFGLADKILDLMNDGKTRYVDQIAERLDVDFMEALEVCGVLLEQGKLYQDIEKGFVNKK